MRGRIGAKGESCGGKIYRGWKGIGCGIEMVGPSRSVDTRIAGPSSLQERQAQAAGC